VENEPSTLDKLDPATPERMLAELIYEVQTLRRQLEEVIGRVMPLVEKAETMLATTPTQRLMKILRPEKDK